MMQQICSALYDRTHALQKVCWAWSHPNPHPDPDPTPTPTPTLALALALALARALALTLALALTQPLTRTLARTLSQAFIYLDEKGEGWLPLADFESALLLVLSPETDDPEELAKQVMMAPQVRPVRR
jgi:hypothetical protein